MKIGVSGLSHSLSMLLKGGQKTTQSEITKVESPERKRVNRSLQTRITIPTVESRAVSTVQMKLTERLTVTKL